MVSLIAYAYKAVDASDVVRYSIMYTIIVVGISLFILLPKKKFAIKKVVSKAEQKIQKLK